MPIAEDFVKFAKEMGAIPAYAYLGDVGESVTGDKKAQKFEDAYLPELLVEIKKIGMKNNTFIDAFDGATVMHGFTVNKNDISLFGDI